MKLNNVQRPPIYISAILILSAVIAHFTGLSPFLESFPEYFRTVNFGLNVGAFLFVYLMPAYLFSRPPKQELLWAFSCGIVLTLVIYLIDPTPRTDSWWIYTSVPCRGFGLAFFFAIVIGFFRAPNHLQKQRNLDLLIWGGFTMALTTFAPIMLRITFILHPITYDIVAYRIDNGFGFQASTLLARVAARTPTFKNLLELSYFWIVPFLAILYGIQVSSKKRPPASLLLVWVISLPWALLSYNLVPVAGPFYQFGNLFPLSMPALSAIADGPSMVRPYVRNGFPSMHLAWALMIWMAASLQGIRWLKWLTAIAVVLTILATLGKGEHYLIDLVVAIPFIIAVQSYCMHVDDAGQVMRRQAVALGAGLWLFWICALRYGLAVFEFIPGLVWVLSIATIVLSAQAYRRVLPHALWRDVEMIELPVTVEKTSSDRAVNRIALMFFISGFTGLMYEVIFSKELALTFGGMATATYTVLTVYMGGMAIGAWIGGRLMLQKRNALVLYAGCELAIGLYCLATPVLFHWIRDAYVVLAAGMAPDAGILLALRVCCGAVVLLIPTVLMGMTLPIMVDEFERRGHATGHAVARLYGANTLGAAAGALMSGYFILPAMGVWRTTALCAVGSMLVAFLALNLSKRLALESDAPSQNKEVDAAASNTSLTYDARQVKGALLALFMVGAVTMIMEVEYMLLLAVVAGNSTYGFSLMLFSLLLGLGAGAIAAQYLLGTRIVKPAVMFALLLIGLACTLLLGVFQWDRISAGFDIYKSYPDHNHMGFGQREWIRGIACWLMMFPPAVIIGACYPIALEVIGAGRRAHDRESSVGSAVALNTFGNIVGTLLGGFILLPKLGALTSIQVAAGLCLAAAMAVVWTGRDLRWRMTLAGSAIVAALFVAQPASFNYTALASGANVYFGAPPIGKVIDHAESLDGGLTSVALTTTPQFGEMKTLLTNGKFQGNNVMKGEMKAQLGFATASLLHTADRSNALVIGYGTGVTARTLKESGFESIDIVDLSRDLVDMSNRHFANVNDRVSEKPGVHTFITDGRNYLLLRDKSYDLISMEITSIWFAGAANLYNREFYQLAAHRMAPKGVLQQWVQLHHLTPLDIGYILGSVKAQFPYVWVYVVGDQGIIIASREHKEIDESTAIAQMQPHAGLMHLFEEVGISPHEIATNLVLDPAGVDRLIGAFGITPELLTSTDDNLFLEYSTPRGNALDARPSLISNIEFLKIFSNNRH